MIIQKNLIKKSYRVRGKQDRIIIIKKLIIKNKIKDFKNILIKKLKNKIILYSDIKIKVNSILLNSVFQPLTNSLSLSEKSKGARFNSAKKINIKILNIKIIFKLIKKIIFILLKEIIKINKIKKKIISKEIL
jgi:hypothetical protein